ncbi:glycosyltransferase family 2 protein [Pelovirga terrestris]|uniref:Glycosyltransferase family 2 protein n=1 Tax=Pelovirga terrestris TaxID=2771352 RepID=A0A8J6QNN0_9BACT|nr:glycosyltransferase family 2 protein [Pelovirga terrestris]MBD1401017.1 glycosyltransferase family 2 protein [Pelovirga terrestris]
MATLSIVLITKNEADKLDACLESVSWADEIVVFDSGSTDNTLEIARRFTDRVYEEQIWPGFGPQRQRAQEKATCDWIMMIDADEVVTPDLQEEIQHAVALNDQSKVYAVPRLTWAFGAYIRHSGWYPDYVVRLYPKHLATYDDAMVHEKVVFGENMQVVKLRGNLLHFTFRDLEQWINKTARYSAAWAEEKYRQGKHSTIFDAVSHAAVYFIKAFFIRKGFLDGRAGFVLAVLGAYSRFIKYTDLWLRQREKNTQ